MLLNEDIVEMEKNVIRSLTFVGDYISGLILHLSIFAIIHSSNNK